MSTRGPTAVQGRLRLCGTCGGVVAFVELYGDGRMNELESARLILATRMHFVSSPACRDGGTFEGADVGACRCPSPLRIERPRGLFCAKCNGLIAPYLRPPEPSFQKGSGPCRPRSTRS